VIEISKEAVELSRKIIELRERDRKKIAYLGKSAKPALLLLERLYNQPFITAKNVIEITKLAPPNANNLIKKFLKLGVLKEWGNRKRNRVFFYEEYLNLFHQKE